MLTAVVTTSHSGLPQVTLLGADTCKRTDLEGEPEFPIGSEECPELNPIAPEAKEMIWGFGAFVVLAICMRYWLYPKVRQGMNARYDRIQGDRESAETLTAAARADVAENEARLASVRAEAHQQVEAARATLESERSARLAEVNAEIAERKAAAAAEVEAARAAAMGDIEAAVSDVVGRAAEIAVGRQPSPDAVRSAVRGAMGSEVSA